VITVDFAVTTSRFLGWSSSGRMADEGTGVTVPNKEKVGLDLFTPRDNFVIWLA
jgi:hypothetical protein